MIPRAPEPARSAPRPELLPALTPRDGVPGRPAPGAGFTLLEVLVALIIFAIGMLALALCVPMATKRVSKAGSQTRASALASQAAEELLSIPYSDSDLIAGTHDDPANPHDGIYYLRWVVEDDAPLSRCKRITLKVSRRSVSAAPEAQIVVVTTESGG